MIYRTFSEFLEYKHFEQYTGHKEQIEDDLDRWLAGLDTEEVIKYADQYADQLTNEEVNVTRIYEDN